ncbi:hypothetical protein [Nitrososphaera sp.]|uniref:hypothetical protein n=1 Tax=Nitrososphaera sp. TaxID=1971748 RepID=UPI00307DDBE1
MEKAKAGSWCLVEIGGTSVVASVVHVGRGKFIIVEDKAGGAYAGKKIDASDILRCNL